MGYRENGAQREICSFKYLYKKRRYKIRVGLPFYFKKLKKKSKLYPRKVKEIINIRAETNGTENRKTMEKIKETKTWFFEKINKTNKPLARLTTHTKKKIQIAKIRNEQKDITIHSTEIKRIKRDYVNNFMPIHQTPQMKWKNS